MDKESIEESFEIITQIINEYHRGKYSMNRTLIELIAEIKSITPTQEG